MNEEWQGRHAGRGTQLTIVMTCSVRNSLPLSFCPFMRFSIVLHSLSHYTNIFKENIVALLNFLIRVNWCQ